MNKKLKELLIAMGLKVDATDQEAQAFIVEKNITVINAESDNPTIQAAKVDPVIQATGSIRVAAADEQDRINAINALTGSGTMKVNSVDVDIKAHAVREGWTPEKAELELLRSARSTPAVIIGSAANVSNELITASARLGVRHVTGDSEASLVAAGFKPQVIEQAARRPIMRISELIRACCALEGTHIPFNATPDELIRAGFSTTSFTGILGNTLRKAIDYMFNTYPGLDAVRRLSRRESVIDFKEKAWYRLSTGGGLPKISPEGNLKYDNVKDSEKKLSIESKGKIIGIDRQTLINDDLGAFIELPRLLTQDASQQFIADFWALLVANTGNFFSTNNLNINTEGLPVGPDGYDVMAQLLAEQTYNGMPLMLSPRFVVVGTANMAKARRMAAAMSTLVLDRKVGSSVTTTSGPDVNIYTDLEPIVSPYISGDDFYGFADPNFATAIRAGFLNGVESPTVEEVSDRIAPEFLGRAWRVVFDYGFAFADPQGAVKMTTSGEQVKRSAKK